MGNEAMKIRDCLHWQIELCSCDGIRHLVESMPSLFWFILLTIQDQGYAVLEYSKAKGKVWLSPLMEGNRRAGNPNSDQLPESGLVGVRLCFVLKFGFGCVWFSGNLLQREECNDTVKSWLSALGKSPVFLSWPCPFRKQTWPCSKLSLNNNKKKNPHVALILYISKGFLTKNGFP